ncbi:ATP-binding protein [Kutzneria sp. NPDC052558]|uniref:sensor histidine kinase n=1 Tax=Kutzneria sp. NPDC052558 TaxID=3364121 RepID=UPI0037C5E3BA
MGRQSGSAPPSIGIAVLVVVPVAVVILMTMAVLLHGGWLWPAALLTAVGGLGAGAVIVVCQRRLASSNATLRGEIDSLAGQPLTEMLAEAVRSRDIEGFRRQLPVFSDAGLARLTGRIEDACATALRMAAEHEDLRLGYSEVFVNMFRRTQSLLQRQLQVIERLEQGNRSPEDMHLFFQLDHLMTRMRRHSENVLVLAGTELVRATKNPVTIADVFRAAMSEVDKYQKIRVLGTPSVRISNTAAGDLIRIIAELLDNATTFSPPDKEVTINAELGRRQGLSIGVFDNGIGMSDKDIHRVNEQLTRLGSVEIARSRRVGLFVVGRLAGRNGFKVELFGGDDVEGVSALVSVPSSVLLEEDAVRAMLPGDSRRAGRGAKRGKLGGSAVAVTTSLRRPAAARAVREAPSTPRQMSSWYSTSQAWRTERDTARGRRVSAVSDAERIERTHADVPVDLPVRVPGGRAAEQATVAPNEQPPRALVDRAGEPSAVRTEAQDPDELVPTPLREPALQDDDRDARVASRWFRARGAADDPSPPAGTSPPGENGRPAESETNSYTYTEDGLPMRRQGTHLQQAIAGGEPPPDAPTQIRAVERDPAHMRRRLSSYQLGVRKAKEQEDRMRGKQEHAGGWTVLDRKATQ